MSEERALAVNVNILSDAQVRAVGGIAGADLGLAAYLIAADQFSAAPLLLAVLAGAVLLGIAAGMLHTVYQRSESGMRRFNGDLLTLHLLAERGEMGQEEYQLLRTRLIDNFEPHHTHLTVPVMTVGRAALLGATLVLLGITFGSNASSLYALLALLAGGAAGAAISSGALFAHRQSQAMLPAGKPHESLPPGEPISRHALESGPRCTE